MLDQPSLRCAFDRHEGFADARRARSDTPTKRIGVIRTYH
jgi:hypothetical protein